MTNIVEIGNERSYDLGLGWRNHEGRINGPNSGVLAGGVSRWITKGGLPVMVPDGWANDQNPDIFEPLPKGTKAITIDNDLVIV